MHLFTIHNVNYKNMISYPPIEIEEGVMTFICGKSGSGKSTLLKLLNAAITADSGDIYYHGKPITDYDPIILRRKVMLVSQNVYLFEDTIKNNFATFYSYRDQQPPSDVEITKYLSLCLADFPLETLCNQMSGGERQRIFIAICLSFMPEVLMLDEPTSALDEHTSDLLIRNLKEYSKDHGITLIAITHDKELARRYADRRIDLNLEV